MNQSTEFASFPKGRASKERGVKGKRDRRAKVVGTIARPSCLSLRKKTQVGPQPHLSYFFNPLPNLPTCSTSLKPPPLPSASPTTRETTSSSRLSSRTKLKMEPPTLLRLLREETLSIREVRMDFDYLFVKQSRWLIFLGGFSRLLEQKARNELGEL